MTKKTMVSVQSSQVITSQVYPVLVVAAEEMVSSYVSHILGADYSVTGLSNSGEVYAYLFKEKPYVIVIDESVSDDEVVSILLSVQDGLPFVRTVYLTPQMDLERCERWITSGLLSYYVKKPIRLSRLKDVLVCAVKEARFSVEHDTLVRHVHVQQTLLTRQSSILATVQTEKGDKRLQPHIQLVSIGDLLTRLRQYVSGFLAKKKVVLEMSVPQSVSVIYTDPDLMELILSSVLDGLVCQLTAKETLSWEVRVTENGFEHIFSCVDCVDVEGLMSADELSVEQIVDARFGLSLVRLFIERLGGKIVYTVVDGQFVLTLSFALT